MYICGSLITYCPSPIALLPIAYFLYNAVLFKSCSPSLAASLCALALARSRAKTTYSNRKFDIIDPNKLLY